MSRRVFILCEQNLDPFRLAVFQHFIDHPAIEIVGAGINFRKTKPKTDILKREWRKGRGGYILVMMIQKLMRKSQANQWREAEDFFGQHDIPSHRIRKLYAPETEALIRATKPDCISLNGFGIIKEPILSLAPHGVISYHHGDMRKYRGGPPAFWELYHNESKIGVTVQRLAPALDAGQVLVYREFSIEPGDSWARVWDRIYQGSSDMATIAIEKLSQTAGEEIKGSELGKIYTLPNLRQWLSLQLRILLRKMKLA